MHVLHTMYTKCRYLKKKRFWSVIFTNMYNYDPEFLARQSTWSTQWGGHVKNRVLHGFPEVLGSPTGERSSLVTVSVNLPSGYD